jgi:hypothetical protein
LPGGWKRKEGTES